MSPTTDITLFPNGKEPAIWYIIGAVRYLADNTRPDLLIVAGILGSFQKNSSLEHVKAARHLLRYVNYIKNYFLTLGGYFFDPRLQVDASFRPQGDNMSTYGYATY